MRKRIKNSSPWAWFLPGSGDSGHLECVPCRDVLGGGIVEFEHGLAFSATFLWIKINVGKGSGMWIRQTLGRGKFLSKNRGRGSVGPAGALL